MWRKTKTFDWEMKEANANAFWIPAAVTAQNFSTRGSTTGKLKPSSFVPQVVNELTEMRKQWANDFKFVDFTNHNQNKFAKLCLQLLHDIAVECQDIMQSQVQPLWDEKLNVYERMVHQNEVKAHYSVIAAELSKRQKEMLVLKSNLKGLIMQKNTFDNTILTCMEKIAVLFHKYPENDAVYTNEFKTIKRRIEIEKKRMSARLPIYARRDEIVKTVNTNSVVVIKGETGSGKSTQIPQYICEMGIGNVICTQPRKVAAISLAFRVAEECNSTVGQIVSYRVGGSRSNALSAENRIVFVTDHILLDMLVNDPLLTDYACVIVDEAHERSIYTDVLLGFLKNTLQNRNDLKVIVTSATIDTNLFTRYFDDCPALSVSGSLFPVDIKWHDDPVKDYFNLAINTAIDILDRYAVGDILVFLVTPDETEKACVKLMKNLMRKSKVTAIPLHGKLQPEDQQRVFNCIEGKRKVIFATNCAETSITIPGIRFVVDTGMIKERNFDTNSNVFALRVHKISRSSAIQRSGRAGRTQCGICYRLYSEKNYDAMQLSATPEIHRVHLSYLVLKMIQLGITDVKNFPFIEPPNADNIRKALNVLILLKAINPSPLQLTLDGMKFCKLPVDPRLAKIVIDSIKLGMSLEGIIVAAALSISCNVFCRYGTEEEKNDCDKRKVNFCSQGGDIFCAITVYLQWRSIRNERKRMAWCTENKVNSKMINVFDNTVSELRHAVTSNGMTTLINLSWPSEIHDTLCSSLRYVIFQSYCDNLFVFTGHNRIGYYAKSGQYLMHPSSTLIPLGVTPQFVVCQDVLSTSDTFLMSITPVEKEWVEGNHDMNEYIELDAMDGYLAVARKIRNLSSSILFNYNSSYKVWNFCKELLQTEKIRCHLECNVVEGYLKVTAIKQVIEKAVNIITDAINIKKRELKNALLRLNMPQRTIQLIIGNGIIVKDILSDGEFLDVAVTLLCRDYTCPSQEKANDVAERITVAIKSFGEMYSEEIDVTISRDCRQIKLRKITYKSAASRIALQKLDKTVISNYTVSIWSKSQVVPRTKLQVCWARRPHNGKGTIVCHSGLDAVSVRTWEFPKTISLTRVIARVDKRCKSNLLLQNVPTNLSEKSFLNSFLIESRNRIDKVRFHREKVLLLEPLKHHRRQLREVLDSLEFKYTYAQIDVKPIRSNKESMVRSQVEFYQLNDAIKARDILHNNVFNELSHESLAARLFLTRSIRCKPDVMQVLSSKIDEIQANLKSDKEQTVLLDIYPADSKCYLTRIVLKGYDEIIISQLAAYIGTIVEPDIVRIESAEVFEYLASKKGSKILRGISVGVVIKLDYRTRSILVYGDRCLKDQAIARCKEIKQVAESQRRVIKLVARDKPKGLIKEMIKRFGINLGQLQELSGASVVRLNMKDRSLLVIGADNSIKFVQDEIEVCCREIGCGTMKADDEAFVEENKEECATCFGTIDAESFRLQYCGHIYCRECIKNQAAHALTTCNFPLNCASCDEGFVVADLENLSIELPNDKLSEMLLSEFVQRNSNVWHFCPTPGCISVYKVSDEHNNCFNCSLCQMNTCKACHMEAHPGITCDNIRLYKEDPDRFFARWVCQSPDKVKKCPRDSCSAVIEKIEGCNHMHCSVCNIHFCWSCRAAFESSAECYEHLLNCHGSYM